jgi:hypothetical protein
LCIKAWENFVGLQDGLCWFAKRPTFFMEAVHEKHSPKSQCFQGFWSCYPSSKETRTAPLSPCGQKFRYAPSFFLSKPNPLRWALAW